MSGSLKITVHTVGDFKCTVRNVVSLLKKANFSIEDGAGLIQYFGSGCEWEKHKNSDEQIAVLEKEKYLFRVFGADSQMLKVSVQDTNSFSLWAASHPKKAKADDSEYFDFNWYYVNMIHAFDKDKAVVERVVFEQY